MPNRPQDGTSRDAVVPDSGPPLDSVKATQQAEAAAAKREADAKLAQTTPAGKREPRPAGDSRKPHGDKLAGTTQEASDEPVVEDEP
jgi:hypothetical protein